MRSSSSLTASPAPIGVAERSRGSIRFTPTDGFDRTRSIVAVVEQDGIPRPGVTVARYVAPPPIRPSRPGRLRIRRRGSRVIVRWGAARRTHFYRIFIASSDGRRELGVTSRRTRRLVLRRILPSERLRISVRGEFGPTHRDGPARRGLLKAKAGRTRPPNRR